MELKIKDLKIGDMIEDKINGKMYNIVDIQEDYVEIDDEYVLFEIDLAKFTQQK